MNHLRMMGDTGQVATTTSRKNTTGTTYANRVVGARGYDRLGRLLGITWETGSADALAGRSYTMDAYGRRTGLIEDGSDKDMRWTYGYDDLGQLTSAGAVFQGSTTEVPGSLYQYAYDDIGNPQRRVRVSALRCARTRLIAAPQSAPPVRRIVCRMCSLPLGR